MHFLFAYTALQGAYMAYRKPKAAPPIKEAERAGYWDNVGYYDFGKPEQNIDIANICDNCPVFANIPKSHFDEKPSTGSYVSCAQNPPRTREQAAEYNVAASFTLKEEHRYPDYATGNASDAASVAAFLTDVPKTATDMFIDANRTFAQCSGPREVMPGDETNTRGLATGSLMCGAANVRMHAIQPEGWLNPRTVS